MSIFEKLRLRVILITKEVKILTYSELFCENSEHFSMEIKSEVIDDEENGKLMDQLEDEAIKFKDIIIDAEAPVKCCCCRLSCFETKTVPVFHSDDQLE